MKQGDDAVALVKERADIVQVIGETVELRRSGSRFVGLCPFHGEKTPSFSVSASEQYFHCFGCGESGDVLSYVMKRDSLTFPEALRLLADRYGVILPERKLSAQERAKAEQRKKMFALNGKVADLYMRYLWQGSHAKIAREYLLRRGISRLLAERYSLGYAPHQDNEGWDFLSKRLSADESACAVELGLISPKKSGGYYDRFRDRILFPIRDIAGQICGFGGRIIGEGSPKYMNSPESDVFSKSNLLLGLYQQKDALRKAGSAILVEGNFDQLSLVANGVENVVAPLGTALTAEHVRLVKRFCEEALLCFDGDGAGKKAAIRGVPLFLHENVAGRVVLLPEGEDPDTFVRKEGAERFAALMQEAPPLPEFAFDELVREHGLSLDGKSRILDGLRPLLAAASSSLQKSVMLAYFAEQLSLDVVTLEQNLNSEKRVHGKIGRVAPVQKSPKPTPVPNVTLSSAQKRVVQFMLLYPDFYERLEELGVRETLQGTAGEIIFLQLGEMKKKNPLFEPEEFLAFLPSGAERALVAKILLAQKDIVAGSTAEQEFADLGWYLKVEPVKRLIREIMNEIEEASRSGDVVALQKLLEKKISAEGELRALCDDSLL